MKILYVYDKMPSHYLKYLKNILDDIKKVLFVKSLTYMYDKESDHYCNSYGIIDNFQRILYKLKLSKYKSEDLKTMSLYDIIHFQHSFMWRKVIPFISLSKRPKIVITLRGADTYMKPWMSEDWKRFYSDFGDKVDAFITMSEHQKKYLTRWGINENKIFVIPISFGKRAIQEPKKPNKDILKLVSVFRMTWEKNIEGSMSFARKLKEKNIAFQYDVFGDGNDLAQLYYFIDRYQLHNYVNVKGSIDNDVLKTKLRDYDFLVQLSYTEALPTTVLEAQSAGLPCVVSNSDGLAEAVIPNETAISYHFSELDLFVVETIKLWKDEQRYYSFSEKAIKYVNQNFSIEKEIDRLKNLYENLMTVE